jgi:hypothetical protein
VRSNRSVESPADTAVVPAFDTSCALEPSLAALAA